MGSPPIGSLGLQHAAGLFILVASWLGTRAAVLVGPEGAILEGFTHCAALCSSVYQPQAVWVLWGAWKESSRSKFVVCFLLDEATAWHGPWWWRRWWSWWRRRRGGRDLEHLAGKRNVVRALRQTHKHRAVWPSVLRAVETQVGEVALAVPAAALVRPI
eukprot:COSAG02_NODE_448_length_22102_cov_11.767032_9_plen_159_part_00